MLTDAQKAQRAQGIGSSEVAAVIGVNPWRSAHDVWASKTGRDDCTDPIDEESEAIVRGNVKEPMLVRWYEAETGRKVRYHGRHQITKPHARYPIIMATPDGLVGSKGTLECKAPGWRTIQHWGEPGTDAVPRYYIPQATCQMAVFERAWTDFAVDMGDRLGVYRVHYNAALFDILVDRCQAFWHNHVLTGTPPPADNSVACERFLGRYYPEVAVEPLGEASDEVQALMRTYKEYDQQVKDLSQELTGIKNELREKIGENRGYEAPGIGKIIWSQVKGRLKTDWQAIAKEAGASSDLIDKHTHIGQSHRRLAAYWSKTND